MRRALLTAGARGGAPAVIGQTIDDTRTPQSFNSSQFLGNSSASYAGAFTLERLRFWNDSNPTLHTVRAVLFTYDGSGSITTLAKSSPLTFTTPDSGALVDLTLPTPLSVPAPAAHGRVCVGMETIGPPSTQVGGDIVNGLGNDVVSAAFSPTVGVTQRVTVQASHFAAWIDGIGVGY